MIKQAVLSPCGRYRYRLARTWDRNLPTLVFVMLNPSTANAEEDDPTIRKCIGFAERLGFGGIEVVNLFAWRATDPKALRKQSFMSDFPVTGPENDRFIDAAVTLPNATVVFAWGGHGQDHVLRMFTVRDNVRRRLSFENGRWPQCLGYTKNRHPRHPLMLPYATALEPYIG